MMIPRLEAGIKEDLFGDSRWKWVEQVKNSYFGNSTKTFGELISGHPQIKKVDWGGFDTDTNLGKIAAGFNGNLFADLLIEVKEPTIYEYDLKIYFKVEEGRRPRLVSVQGLENSYGLPTVLKNVASFIKSLENPTSNLLEDFKLASNAETEVASLGSEMFGGLPATSEPAYLVGLTREEMLQRKESQEKQRKEEQDNEPNFIAVNGQVIPNPNKHSNGQVVSAQPSENPGDGPFKIYYPNGTVKQEGQRKNGLPDGLIKEYYADGAIQTEFQIVAGKKMGSYITYFQDGVVWETGSYKNDQLDGHYTVNYSNGAVKEEGQKKNGLQDGVVKAYYPNGAIHIETQVVAGKNNGGFTSYFQDGTVELVGKFKNGKEDGYFKGYYPNGKIRKEADYKDGMFNGAIKDYYPDESLKGESWAKDGLNEGESKEYFQNGQLKEERNYKNGLPVGLRKIYDPAGTIVMVCEYSHGMVSESCKGYGKWSEVTGNERFYYPSGKLMYEIAFVRGVPHGAFKVFSDSANGKIEREGMFVAGKLTGLVKEYFDTGELKREITFEEGTKNGPTEFFYRSGKVDTKGHYRNWLKDGIWTEYNEDGSLVKQTKFQAGREVKG